MYFCNIHILYILHIVDRNRELYRKEATVADLNLVLGLHDKDTWFEIMFEIMFQSHDSGKTITLKLRCCSVFACQ